MRRNFRLFRRQKKLVSHGSSANAAGYAHALQAATAWHPDLARDAQPARRVRRVTARAELGTYAAVLRRRGTRYQARPYCEADKSPRG